LKPINKPPSKIIFDQNQKPPGKIVFDQNQKHKNEPTSDQILAADLMKDAWNADNSPFKGTPFDPSVLNLSENDSVMIRYDFTTLQRMIEEGTEDTELGIDIVQSNTNRTTMNISPLQATPSHPISWRR